MLTFFFITIAKAASMFAKLFGRGSGTALPGLIIERYYPQLFQKFTDQLDQVILITGTNGKTTTRAILNEILNSADIHYITNQSGSNMSRGLLSAMISRSNIFGKLNSKFAVFEVEEATLPKIILNIQPSILIVTNLFRDQLDAYGEVNKTREYIRDAIEQMPETQLVLNADDPLVSTLNKDLPNTAQFFGLPEKYRQEFLYEHESKETAPEKVLRPEILKVNEDLSSKFVIGKNEYNLSVPGIYHIYNALAAIQTTSILGINPEGVKEGITNFQPAFGRGEKIEYKGKTFQIFLVKNPAGLTLTLHLLSQLRNIKILFILNDRIADGRDVSWIWDADIELISEVNPQIIVASGIRAKDMGLRIKYAGVESIIESDIRKAIDKIIVNENSNDDKKPIYVLPTYTAMNEFRKILGRKF